MNQISLISETKTKVNIPNLKHGDAKNAPFFKLGVKGEDLIGLTWIFEDRFPFHLKNSRIK